MYAYVFAAQLCFVCATNLLLTLSWSLIGDPVPNPCQPHTVADAIAASTVRVGADTVVADAAVDDFIPWVQEMVVQINALCKWRTRFCV